MQFVMLTRKFNLRRKFYDFEKGSWERHISPQIQIDDAVHRLK